MSGDDVEIGEVLGGKYRVDRIIGQGTMGVVLAATQIGLDRTVALKVMCCPGAFLREHVERFQREARVAAMLKSPHAAKVLDIGQLASGAPYIVMEFLEGHDLEAIVNERGPLPVEEAIALVLQASEAIAEAHALGIVHRDLKPANLFLTTGPGRAPCVKVLDFGVSKHDDGSAVHTKPGQVLGSPLYMAPEQLSSSKDVDARSDVWALGVTLYELLSGTTPFQCGTVLDVCRKLSTEPPTPLVQHRPNLPAGLCAVIMQCLEKNRARRWPNIATFAAALAPFAPRSAAAYIERIAQIQQVDVEPQVPTTALARIVSTERMPIPRVPLPQQYDAQDEDTIVTLVRPLSVARLAHARRERGKAPSRGTVWLDPRDVAGTAFHAVAPASASGAMRARLRSLLASVVLSAVVLAGTMLTLRAGFHTAMARTTPGSGSSAQSTATAVVGVLPPPPASVLPTASMIAPSTAAPPASAAPPEKPKACRRNNKPSDARTGWDDMRY